MCSDASLTDSEAIEGRRKHQQVRAKRMKRVFTSSSNALSSVKTAAKAASQRVRASLCAEVGTRGAGLSMLAQQSL